MTVDRVNRLIASPRAQRFSSVAHGILRDLVKQGTLEGRAVLKVPAKGDGHYGEFVHTEPNGKSVTGYLALNQGSRYSLPPMLVSERKAADGTESADSTAVISDKEFSSRVLNRVTVGKEHHHTEQSHRERLYLGGLIRVSHDLDTATVRDEFDDRALKHQVKRNERTIEIKGLRRAFKSDLRRPEYK